MNISSALRLDWLCIAYQMYQPQWFLFYDPCSSGGVLQLLHFAETAAALDGKSEQSLAWSDLFSWVKLGFHKGAKCHKVFFCCWLHDSWRWSVHTLRLFIPEQQIDLWCISVCKNLFNKHLKPTDLLKEVVLSLLIPTHPFLSPHYLVPGVESQPQAIQLHSALLFAGCAQGHARGDHRWSCGILKKPTSDSFCALSSRCQVSSPGAPGWVFLRHLVSPLPVMQGYTA